MSAIAAAAIAAGASYLSTQSSQQGADSRSAEAFERQKELAALQQLYAHENWARENNYNSPKEQMKRLEQAGLNPNLIYGNGAAGLQSGSINTPSTPSAPQQAPTFDYSKSVTDAVQAAVGMAEADKAKSDKMKTDIENKYLAEQLQSNIEQTKAFTDLSKEQKAEVSMKCQNLSAEWNHLQVQIENARKEGELSQKQIDTFDRRLNNEMDYLESQTDLNKLQKKILEENKDNLLKLAKGQADLSATVAELTNKYGDAQAVIGLVSQVVGSATDIFGMFGSKKLTQIINNIGK